MKNGFLYNDIQVLMKTERGQPFLFSKTGYTLKQDTFLEAAGVTGYVRICCKEKEIYKSVPIDAPVEYVLLNDTGESEIRMALRRDEAFSVSRIIDNQLDFYIRLMRIWAEPGIMDSFLNIIDVNGDIIKLFTRFDCGAYQKYDSIVRSSDYSSIFDLNTVEPKAFPFIAEYKMEQVKTENNIMRKVIQEYLGDNIWIPYNMEERRKNFREHLRN